MDLNMDAALRMSNVTFRWAATTETATDGDGQRRSQSGDSQASTAIDHVKYESFSLGNIDLAVPRGLLVALVGRVGSGKSSLLQGVSPLLTRC